MENSSLRLFLESLCHNSSWDYAVFWKLQNNPPNMLLTWENGYYDVHRPGISDESLFGQAVAEMATTCYAIGEGVIGEAAYMGVAQWFRYDNIANYGFSSSLLSQYAHEWLPQFAAGIKTILLIPSLPDGVLQLGSFETIREDGDLVTNIKDKFAANQKLDEYLLSFWSTNQSSVIMFSSSPAENLYDSSFDNFRAKEDHVPLMNVVDPVAAAPYNHEVGFFSSSNDNHTRVSMDYTNEMIDFYLNGVAMEPPLRNNGYIMDHSTQYTQGFSDSVYSKDFNRNLEPLSWDSGGLFVGVNGEGNLPEAVLTNASSVSVSDYSSFNLPINARGRFVSDSEQHLQPGTSGTAAREDSGPRSCVTSATGYGNARQEKGCDLLHRRNMSNLSTINRKRAKPGDNQKPKPRDRQLIQDRVKELRELVPNVAKCSIDGLLDKTIKHMVFLQSITERADKLRHQVVKEVSERVKPNSPVIKDNGTSWALDLAGEKQICPIIVKDLEFPGQMLIEMVCDDYGRFLEITDVILRLELTILKGVMEKQSDGTRAQFIVETRGSFHRLDLFWPLMQLLQQNTVPISSRI